MQKLEPAFILHRYPYQDHSVLLKIFTPHSGLLTAIAKGAKKPKSPWYGLLEPFSPLLIHCRGRGEVLSLRQAEAAGKPYCYQQANLLTAFYLNELLMTFLHPQQEYSNLFSKYHNALEKLSIRLFEGDLREFELSLLQELGLAPEFSVDANYQSIEKGSHYGLFPGNLPEKVDSHYQGMVLTGEELLAIHKRQWENAEHLKAAKLLLRHWIGHYSKGKVFKSRELFMQEVKE